MSLPLEQRATEDDLQFLITPAGVRPRQCGTSSVSQLPPPPGPGEQYRFHFDMTKCIGCRCCEVACSEQNNNPAEIHWRRVGEIEGGWWPHTQRLYLSMGCNHCLDPACLNGCPVDAYSKDSATGLVQHSADACIGCQYCIWNCPYGVPQFNPERGVVGKCDMCYGRLATAQLPACSAACPQEAIRIETVNIAEWKRGFALDANSPGMPPAEETISTTRITLPETMPSELQKADYHRVRPESPHLPLVFMLVLTQLSVGAFAVLSFSQRWLHGATLASLAVALLSLGASTLHLGRPIHFYRALKMWRRSWLSREALFLTLFAAAAPVSALLGSTPLGVFAVLSGAAGIFSSARLYIVPARPSWNSSYTLADFFSTAALLGSLCGGWTIGAIAGAAAQLLVQALRFMWLVRSDEFELRASARLLSSDVERLFLTRLALLVAGGIILPLAGLTIAGLAVALAGELTGRYLFFVTVVPRNMAASFFERRAA